MTEESLFTAALNVADPAEQRAFLDGACAGDAALRARVDLLLEADRQPRGILEHGPDLPAVSRSHPPVAGRTLAGRYTLRRKLGEGGMGEVWVADQTEPVRRTVAVKLVRAGCDTARLLVRFEVERQALALMDHPNIAKVYDAGLADPDRADLPFVVMEFIDGVPVTDYCDTTKLSARQRLELFLPVCQAVQHAHQKGVIHRDLKPSNVLVTMCDGTAVPKVIDFGVAKATGPRLTDQSLHTEAGTLVGTLEYMSPEQAELNNPDIDTRSDVYSLGVLLYELLSGRPPFTRQEMGDRPLLEMLQVIRGQDPTKPSAKLSTTEGLQTVASNRGTDPARLVSTVRGELDWIVLKCLEKDRGRRYDTAAGLAADVRRYLADEPVSAGPPTNGYRLRKYVRRHWRGLTAAATFLLLLLATVATLSAALVAVNRERLAKEAALDAEGKRRKQVRAALDAMSSQITEDWLARQPSHVPQHKRFLEQALRLYEEFVTDTGRDEESRAGVAHAYWRVGIIRMQLAEWSDAQAALERSRGLYADIAAEFPNHTTHREMHARVLHFIGNLYDNTGQSQEAEAALEQSRAAYQSLVTEFPTDPDYRHGLGIALNHLGVLFKNRSRFPTAVEIYGQSIAIHRQLVAEFPTDPEFRGHLAQTQMNLGILHDITGRPREAEEAHRQAVAHYERLAAEHPTSPRYTEGLATSRSNLAEALRVAGKHNHAEAEEVFHLALAGRRKLVAEFPAVPDYRRGLAITVNNLGILLKDTDRVTEAEVNFAEAIAIHKGLADDFPAASNHQNEAAGAMGNLARLKLVGKEYAAARRLFEQALPYHQAALRANPDHPAYRKFYRLTRWWLAEAFLGLTDHAAAAESVAEFLRYTTEPPRDHYTAATLLAGCVRLAVTDEHLTEAKRQELATSYGDSAMAALRRAVELKGKEVARMKTDIPLDPLRTRDDFTKLLAEFESDRYP